MHWTWTHSVTALACGCWTLQEGGPDPCGNPHTQDAQLASQYLLLCFSQERHSVYWKSRYEIEPTMCHTVVAVCRRVARILAGMHYAGNQEMATLDPTDFRYRFSAETCMRLVRDVQDAPCIKKWVAHAYPVLGYRGRGAPCTLQTKF